MYSEFLGHETNWFIADYSKNHPPNIYRILAFSPSKKAKPFPIFPSAPKICVLKYIVNITNAWNEKLENIDGSDKDESVPFTILKRINKKIGCPKRTFPLISGPCLQFLAMGTTST